MVCLYDYESPVGMLSLASDGAYLCGLWLEGQKYFQDKLALRTGCRPEEDGNEHIIGQQARKQTPGIEQACAWLDTYFAGHDPGSLPPVALHGTPFQEEVWNCLKEIPYGMLVTYGDIARTIQQRRDGARTCARAVGVAVGRNPVSIIVPCHRVVGTGLNLTGYAGGLDKKKKLLELESIDITQLKTPTKGTAL